MQKAGYVNIEKGNDKSNTATGDAYTWMTAAPALPADEVFTVEATIRLSGAVDGGRTNEFAVRINGTGKYYPIFLKYGADGAVTNQTSFDSAKALDTTSWHNYALVINPTAQQYDVYVDGELVGATPYEGALEELLSVILQYCLHGGGRSYVDIRIFVAEGDAYLRFRWAGRIFDPLRWYEDNRSDPEMAESTLGVKLIAGQAKDISFRETFGANNLLVRF